MEGLCLPRLRVFLDASLLALLVVTAAALRRRVTRPDPPKPDAKALYDYVARSFRRSVALSVLALEAWGTVGLVLSLAHDCPASHWLVALCLSLSGGCLLVGAWLGVREALLTVDCDILTLLWCLRCSCCSRLAKRALLLPPLALLAALNVVSWLESRTAAAACRSSELVSPKTFFAGVAVEFLAMSTATLLAVGWPLVSRRCHAASSRVGKTLVALGLAVFALTSIGWAVVGLLSLPGRRNDVDPATLYSDSCWDDLTEFHAAQWSIAQLLTVGGLLLVTTFCCRLENFFLARDTPEVDVTELSPRLAAIKIPLDADDTKSAEDRAAQDVTVLV